MAGYSGAGSRTRSHGRSCRNAVNGHRGSRAQSRGGTRRIVVRLSGKILAAPVFTVLHDGEWRPWRLGLHVGNGTGNVSGKRRRERAAGNHDNTETAGTAVGDRHKGSMIKRHSGTGTTAARARHGNRKAPGHLRAKQRTRGGHRVSCRGTGTTPREDSVQSSTRITLVMEEARRSRRSPRRVGQGRGTGHGDGLREVDEQATWN